MSNHPYDQWRQPAPPPAESSLPPAYVPPPPPEPVLAPLPQAAPAQPAPQEYWPTSPSTNNVTFGGSDYGTPTSVSESSSPNSASVQSSSYSSAPSYDDTRNKKSILDRVQYLLLAIFFAGLLCYLLWLGFGRNTGSGNWWVLISLVSISPLGFLTLTALVEAFT